jgi:2-phospho-L-lactate guanylyltransferase (CobY/MobA/RfbA family)
MADQVLIDFELLEKAKKIEEIADLQAANTKIEADITREEELLNERIRRLTQNISDNEEKIGMLTADISKIDEVITILNGNTTKK